MTTNDAKVFALHLTRLAIALGEPMPKERIAAYVAFLERMDLAPMLQAIDYYARRSRFFPKPAELWETAQTMRHAPAARQIEDQRDEPTGPGYSLFRETLATLRKRTTAPGAPE